jgi:hypothetical protein
MLARRPPAGHLGLGHHLHQRQPGGHAHRQQPLAGHAGDAGEHERHLFRQIR